MQNALWRYARTSCGDERCPKCLWRKRPDPEQDEHGEFGGKLDKKELTSKAEQLAIGDWKTAKQRCYLSIRFCDDGKAKHVVEKEEKPSRDKAAKLNEEALASEEKSAVAERREVSFQYPKELPEQHVVHLDR